MASLRIIAGPNGSGKSEFGATITNQPVFDFEKTYYAINGTQDPINKERFAIIQELFLDEVKDKLKKGEDFAYESNFSSRYNMEIPDKFKQNGFAIELYYFAMEKPEDSLYRLKEKSKETGIKYAPNTKEVFENHRLGIKYAMETMNRFDKFVLIDNNPDGIPKNPTVILEAEKGKTVFIENKVPKWMALQFDQIKDLKQSASKRRSLGM